jgi:hypothetical protein
MKLSARARAIESSVVAAVAAFLLGTAPLDTETDTQLSSPVTGAITADPGSKSEAREARKAERAAAREAKKKERARAKEERSLAKAGKAKKSESSVNLGDDDPLEGL